MAGLREFMRGYAGEVYRAAAGLLEARRRLAATLEGRELAELAGLGHVVEMLLGGFQPRPLRGQRYPPRSLARFYRDVVGIHVQQPERLAARLRDGLPLGVAGWGVRIASSPTRPLAQIEAVREAAQGLLESLGYEPPEPLEVDTSDPMWAPQALQQLLAAVAKGLPPYSREAILLYSSSASVTDALLETVASSAERAELAGLGLEEYARLPGPGDDPRKLLRRARPGSPLARYRCLVYAGARLLQLSELEAFYRKPDPVNDLVKAAVEQARASPSELGEILDAIASRAARRSHCLPQASCPGEPPCLPPGTVWVEAVMEPEGDTARLNGAEAGLGETMEALAPLMAYGLAEVDVERSGEKHRLRIAFVHEHKPHYGTVAARPGNS